MKNKLAGVCPRIRKAEPVNHIVQAAFQQLHQVISGYTRHMGGRGEYAPELGFHNPISETGLLFLAQLQPAV
jgi:hypothetical protein